jgi:hypothetical protein
LLLVATYFAGFVTSQKLAEREPREAEEKAAAELAAAKAAVGGGRFSSSPLPMCRGWCRQPFSVV